MEEMIITMLITIIIFLYVLRVLHHKINSEPDVNAYKLAFFDMLPIVFVATFIVLVVTIINFLKEMVRNGDNIYE